MSRARTSRASTSSGLDVVCFGEILWDIYAVDPPRGASRDDARHGGGRDLRRELGGAPANVATDLARLGVRSGLVAGIGIDKLGDALEQHLVADGVSTRFLVRLPNRTGLTFVTRDAKGEPSFLFYRQDTADVAVRPEHVTSEMGKAKWVLVGTSTLMTPGLAAATDRFLTMAEQAKANVVVDLNVREHLWASKAQMRESVARLVKRASIVKGSFADLVALTGRRDILWLADNAPNAAWIVTQGAKGASAIGNHGFVARPARKAKCVDATGAGDAFIAGVLAALLEANAAPGRDAWRDERVWAAALDAGHAMGAKAVSRTGSVAGVVGLDEVRSIMKQARRHAEEFEANAKRTRERGRGRGKGARDRRARAK
jgi:fructokinase